MSADTAKIRSRLAKLDKSLDQLESQLEPLLAQSLHETLLALDTIQQAKLQVVIPYVVYDLVFVYLKSRGIDPKTHRVVAELDRVRQYFDKITHAEDADRKRQLGIDKAAAGRFIRHAIAQAKNAQLVDEPSDAPAPSASPSHEPVPVKVTSKMMARAEYDKEPEALGSEEEENLQVFDQEAVDSDEAMDAAESPPEDRWQPAALGKGKGRAEEEQDGVPSLRRKRPRMDPFAGYDNLLTSESAPQATMKPKLFTPVQSLSVDASSRGVSVSTSDDREAEGAAKKANHKAKKSRRP